MPTIEVKKLSKSFEDSIAIQDITFTLPDGELITLLGPSGSGKTTVLRLIAGLIKPDQGEIFFDDQEMSAIPTEERNIGFVFQSYALFPHLTVAENIAFGLQARNVKRKDILERVREMIYLVNLEGKGKRYPHELSGGERSRVALARALAPHPSLLLLDEPLSALDVKLKENLREAIRDIQQKVAVSTIYVTHDQKEAMEISDRIIILNNGKIVEIGNPQKLYLSPKKRFTAEFLGIKNIITGMVVKQGERYQLEVSFGNILLPELPKKKAQKVLSIGLFPEHLLLSKKSQNTTNEFKAKVTKTFFGGSILDIKVKIDDYELFVKMTSSRTKKEFKRNDQVYLTIPMSAILVLEE